MDHRPDGTEKLASQGMELLGALDMLIAVLLLVPFVVPHGGGLSDAGRWLPAIFSFVIGLIVFCLGLGIPRTNILRKATVLMGVLCVPRVALAVTMSIVQADRPFGKTAWLMAIGYLAIFLLCVRARSARKETEQEQQQGPSC